MQSWLGFFVHREGSNFLPELREGRHRLLNWQIQISKYENKSQLSRAIFSQVPQPTCYWKWVGVSMPQKVGNFSLRPSSTAIWRCSRLSGGLLSSYRSQVALTPALEFYIHPVLLQPGIHVTLPILTSSPSQSSFPFSQVFLLVFPISTFMIFLMCINWWTKNNSVIQTKPSHVVLMPQSAVGLQFEKRILRLIYGRSLYQILPSPILCSSSFKTDNPWQRLTSLNHILVLCSPIPAHTLCIEVRDAGWWLRRLVSEWMGRRRRWQFWRRELVFKLSMNKSDSVTHLYLPSVISR